MRYRKKPVVIEAMPFTGDNAKVISEWAGFMTVYQRAQGHMNIETLEGTMRAEVGDWIIKGVAGEFYPCKPDIFDATYEPVEVSQ